MFEFFAKDPQPSPSQLARDAFFNHSQHAVVSTVDPAEYRQAQGITGKSAFQKPTSQLVSFKPMDLRTLHKRVGLGEIKTLQVQSEEYRVDKRKREISALVDKLYDVKTFTDKDKKGDLIATLEFIEFNVSVMAGSEKVNHIPEKFTNAVHALVTRDILTTKQVEEFIFESENPHLAVVDLINFMNAFHRAFVDKLPEGSKPHQVQVGDEKTEKLYRDVQDELKSKFLEEYGIR